MNLREVEEEEEDYEIDDTEVELEEDHDHQHETDDDHQPHQHQEHHRHQQQFHEEQPLDTNIVNAIKVFLQRMKGLPVNNAKISQRLLSFRL